MTDVKSPVQIATRFLKDAVGDVEGVRVEEAERAGDDWFVTLSYLAMPDGPMAALQIMVPRRLYRRFHVVGDGVVPMKIREPEDA